MVDYNKGYSGTENVRVVDMSIAPLQVAAHLLDTAYAIGEKASRIFSYWHAMLLLTAVFSGIRLGQSREKGRVKRWSMTVGCHYPSYSSAVILSYRCAQCVFVLDFTSLKTVICSHQVEAYKQLCIVII